MQALFERYGREMPFLRQMISISEQDHLRRPVGLVEFGGDEVVVTHGVSIHGPSNLPATMPVHASQLYARNVTELLRELVKDGALAVDFADEVVQGACVTHGGAVVNEAVKAALAERKTA